MKFDRLSMFADKATIPTTASKDTASAVIDLRKNGQIGIDGHLRVWGGIVSDVNTTGSITTTLQTSDDGSSWTSLMSQAQDGKKLAEMTLPPTGLKRYIRLQFSVGTTALSKAVTVTAGLVDQFDIDELPAVQTFPPLEDVAAAGETVVNG
jgi:hypothetical protein